MDSVMEDNPTSSSTFQLDISSSGAVKLKDAVKAKLAEFMGSYTDDVLAEYVVVLVGHGKRQAQAIADLDAFLGEQSKTFVVWLWDHLSANTSSYVAHPSLPVAEANAEDKQKSSEVLEVGPSVKDEQAVSQGDLAKAVTPGLNVITSMDDEPIVAVQDSSLKLAVKGKMESAVQALPSGRGKSGNRGAQYEDDQPFHDEYDYRDQPFHNDEYDYHDHSRGYNSKRSRSPEPRSRRGRGFKEERHQQKSDASPPRVRAPRRLLESAVRDAVGPAGVLMSSGSASRRAESRLLESAVRDAVGSASVATNNAVMSRRTDRTESRLLESAVRDAVGSAGVSVASGSTSRRTESRLLDSAVRDAVGHAVNPSWRAESGFKRLRSVVLADADNPELASEANGRHHHLKARLDPSKQGSKVAPAMAVALKAAAAAAEDVNNSGKSRGRSSGSVWDRLGSRRSESLALKGNAMEEVGRTDADNAEVEETWVDIKVGSKEEGRTGKRPKLRKVSDRLGNGPREEEDEIPMDSDFGPGDSGYLQDKMSAENEWHGSVGLHLKDSEEVNSGEELIEDAVDLKDGRFFRYGAIKDPHEHILGKSQDLASLQYRNAGVERTIMTGQESLVPGSSGSVNFFNKVGNNHINSDVRNQQPQDALKVAYDLPSQLFKGGASMGKSNGLNSPGVDTSDVLEMKKRMRQVQLEMTKLRAKQAEVSKEVQKVGSAPGSGVKSRSQDEVDVHSICVTNIHFAATKETIAAHFNSCGDIVRVTVLMESTTGKPKGSAYVEFSSKDGVENALNLNDSSLLSRVLKVVRKNASTEFVATPIIGHHSHGLPFVSVRGPPVGNFLRGPPLSLRRQLSKTRPFPGAANLQWKRETSLLGGANGSPKYGHTIGSNISPSSRIAALRSPTASLMGDRYGLGPIRGARSMSYVRPTPYPPRENPPAVQKQKVAN